MSMNYHNPDCVDEKELPQDHRFMTDKEVKERQKYTSGEVVPENLYDPEIQKWDEVREEWIIGKYGFAGDSDFFTYCVPNNWKA